ncbi:MAG TPA: S8 family serine peptidase [Vicinamibacterales bacterium]|nr:S8 family serine peptidase [Vicinamibacterales bacterium]
MSTFTVSVATAAGRTGRGVRIGVVDSGIHAAHPHIRGIAGGAAISEDGASSGDVIDRLGHGTAVAAAIREKAPDAALLAIKVFDRTLATTGRTLAAAIRWAAAQRVAIINLSLGTTNRDHEPALARAIAEARAAHAIVVAAAPQDGLDWLPGALADVIGVELDWACPREACAVQVRPDGTVRLAASGFPRPIPGVAPADNLKGASFAVANASGLLSLAIEDQRVASIADVVRCLRAIGADRAAPD